MKKQHEAKKPLFKIIAAIDLDFNKFENDGRLPGKNPMVVEEATVIIEPFQWKDWNALWQLRSHQLAEDGIIISDETPSQPDLNSPYEKDYHGIDQVYLKGKGNFWIAWMGDDPAGHIGAEDKGDYIELRRMYVREAYRLLGIGTKLVQALIKHCHEEEVRIIELWTAKEGPGCFLYRKSGFREVENVRNENDEIRMCLNLED